MRDWTLSRSYETAGGTVRWDSWGEGEPVVLTHGWPFSSVVWRDIAHALSATHRVYVWDLLGYGQSDMRPGDVSIGAQAEIFAGLLTHWGLDAPAVVGHDFGGAVTLRAHLVHGASYGRMALIDPVALAPWGSPFFRLVRDNVSVFEQLPALHHESLVRGYVAGGSHRGLHPETLEDLVEPWLTDAGRAAFYRQMAQGEQRYTDDIQPRYGEIDIPVTIAWGVEDTWIPVAKAHELATAIGTEPPRLIAGAGHLAQIDAPAQVTAELVRFLDRK